MRRYRKNPNSIKWQNAQIIRKTNKTEVKDNETAKFFGEREVLYVKKCKKRQYLL